MLSIATIVLVMYVLFSIFLLYIEYKYQKVIISLGFYGYYIIILHVFLLLGFFVWGSGLIIIINILIRIGNFFYSIFYRLLNLSEGAPITAVYILYLITIFI